MTRLHSPESGRIVNVDDDQVKDFEELGYRVVKGTPAEADAAPKKSSK